MSSSFHSAKENYDDVVGGIGSPIDNIDVSFPIDNVPTSSIADQNYLLNFTSSPEDNVVLKTVSINGGRTFKTLITLHLIHIHKLKVASYYLEYNTSMSHDSLLLFLLYKYSEHIV